MPEKKMKKVFPKLSTLDVGKLIGSASYRQDMLSFNKAAMFTWILKFSPSDNFCSEFQACISRNTYLTAQTSEE